jgi:diguanylate cyclase (GGDEF)-like protein/PAS domain S-box-containing protein
MFFLIFAAEMGGEVRLGLNIVVMLGISLLTNRLKESLTMQKHQQETLNQQQQLLEQLNRKLDLGLQHADGSYRWFECQGKAHQNGEGKPVPIVGSLRDFSDRKRKQELIRNTSEEVSATMGEAFFKSLVNYLLQTLEIEHAFIGELLLPSHVRIIAGISNGLCIDGVEYVLADTPCEQVAGTQIAIYSGNVQQFFPENPWLAEIGAESYIGISLWDSAGQQIGLMSVLSNRPLQETAIILEVLRFFAVRVSSELERRQAEMQLRQAQTALQTSEAKLSDILDSAVAAISSFCQSLDGSYTYLYNSSGTEVIFGYPPTEMQDVKLWESRVHPADLKPLLSQIDAAILEEETISVEYRFYHRDGSLRWIAGTYTSRWDVAANGWIVTVIEVDISGRKRAEQRLSEEKKILSLITANRPLVDILNQLVVTTESCSCLLVDSTRTRLYTGAAPSLPADYNRQIDSLLIGPNGGSCGTAAYRGERVIVTDIAADPLWVDFHELALSYNLCSCWSQPILSSQDQVLGTFALYHPQSHIPTAEELDIMRSASYLAGIAIEHKRAEVALQQSEALFRASFETAAIGMGLVSLEGQFLSVNTALCCILGFTESELLALSFQEITYNEDLVADLVLLRQTLAGDRSSYQIEKRYLHKNGQIIWALLSVSLVRDLQEQPLYFVSQIQDISDRKQTEAALESSRERYRSLVNNIPGAVYRCAFNPNWTMEYVSLSITELTGYASTDLMNDQVCCFASLVHPDDWAPAHQQLTAAIAAQVPVILEYRLRHRDGNYRWVKDCSQGIFNEAGDCLYTDGILLDISDRKQTEIALRENEARFQRIAANVKVLIFQYMTYPDGSETISYFSPRCWEIFELDPEAVMADTQAIWQLFHPEDLPRIKDSVVETIATLQPFSEEFRVITPSGQLKWIQSSARLELQADGRIIWDGIMLDVTSRHRAEQAVIRREQYLSTLVEVQQQLLGVDQTKEQIYPPVLALLGKVAVASRVYLFENSRDDFGRLLMNQKAEWCAAGISPEIDKPLLQQLPYEDCFPRWAEMLSGGGIIASNVADFPANERQILVPQGIFSILILPLIVNEVFYGFIGFDNCSECRHWEVSEVALLKAAAASLALFLERQQAETRLLHASLHDALTGLPNRRLFIDRLEQALKRHQRDQRSLSAVLFLDLDRFKVINDSLGHAVGDQVLLEVAHRLKESLRSEDTIARLGGDEFVILLENLRDLVDATHCATHLQKTLATPLQLGDTLATTEVSIGIVLVDSRYSCAEEILRDADIAMYAAKTSAGKGFRIFDPPMHAAAQFRLQIEQELRLALPEQQFRVVYQPIVALGTHFLLGFEALIRWHHPERGSISPGEFLPVAEQLGLLDKLDLWVLQTACEQLVQCQQAPQWQDCSLCMSVNISSALFAHVNLVDEVTAILHQTGLSPQALKLEITEGIMATNANEAVEKLRDLKALGIQLNIDDFGTGYSSLSRLQQFPIHALKIDQSFVQKIDQSPENLEIIRTIINLAHTLGLEVIAEGIETDTQRQALLTLGCEYGQGYLFAKPLSPDQLVAWDLVCPTMETDLKQV